jgi:hypothetical protein
LLLEKKNYFCRSRGEKGLTVAMACRVPSSQNL